MQDRYAFDVGDFGKFGLLRHLLAADAKPLGVLWYATSLPSAADDGKHVAYLHAANSAQFRDCDPALYDLFRSALKRGRRRSMAALEGLGALPANTRFHRRPTRSGAARTAWFAEARASVRDTAVVFCDPDNGIANPGSANEQRGSAKHALLHELATLRAAGHALVVYHHLTREKGGHAAQIAGWARRLRAATGAREVAAVRFCRGTSRAFFVVPGPRAPRLHQRLDALAGSPWVAHGHMELHG